VEGGVSIAFGAEATSISLAGFGFDSIIEVISAFFVLYRLARETGHPNSFTLLRERVGTMAIGILFIFLGATTLLGSIVQLVNGHHPSTTLSGIIISLIALAFMSFLWWTKRKASKILDSMTLSKDASCSLACIKLSTILFIGSLLYYLIPTLWWLDSSVAIIFAIMFTWEGSNTVNAARKPTFTGGCC